MVDGSPPLGQAIANGIYERREFLIDRKTTYRSYDFVLGSMMNLLIDVSYLHSEREETDRVIKH